MAVVGVRRHRGAIKKQQYKTYILERQSITSAEACIGRAIQTSSDVQREKACRRNTLPYLACQTLGFCLLSSDSDFDHSLCVLTVPQGFGRVGFRWLHWPRGTGCRISRGWLPMQVAPMACGFLRAAPGVGRRSTVAALIGRDWKGLDVIGSCTHRYLFSQRWGS